MANSPELEFGTPSRIRTRINHTRNMMSYTLDDRRFILGNKKARISELLKTLVIEHNSVHHNINMSYPVRTCKHYSSRNFLLWPFR